MARIRELTSTIDVMPTRVHNLLCRLGHLGVRTWITTNYDDLLESALRDSGQPPLLVRSDVDLTRSAGGAVRVIKLHGDTKDRGSFLFTKNDLFGIRRARPGLWAFLELELIQNSILFLGYSMRDPDFNHVQSEILHMLGEENLRPSYAVVFGSDEITRADCESRKIQAIDLGAKQRENATFALSEFLEGVINLVEQTPKISPEPHDSLEAAELVPKEIKIQLRDQGYELVCCIEYRVYNADLDAGNFFPIPIGWRPRLPVDYLAPEYYCYPYERRDRAMANIWRAWAVGKKVEDRAGSQVLDSKLAR